MGAGQVVRGPGGVRSTARFALASVDHQQFPEETGHPFEAAGDAAHRAAVPGTNGAPTPPSAPRSFTAPSSLQVADRGAA